MQASLHSSVPSWVGDAVEGDLFATGPWFRHFLATALGPTESPRFLEWRSGRSGEPALALALKLARAETFPFPRLLQSMVSYYSCGYGPISSVAPDREALQGIAEALCDQAEQADGVRLGPLDRASAFACACEQGLRSRMLAYWTLAYRNWFAATEGMTYAQYLSKVPSRFPATSERRRQLFLRKGMGTITIVSSEAGLDDHLQAFQRVYGASWKTAEPFPEFIPGLVRLAAVRGWLRLGLLCVGDEPAAAQLWFVADRRALIYKVAYGEAFAKLSVGSMLTCALLEHVLEKDFVREVDFLSGDDAYKAKWMFARRDRHTLLAFNPRRWRGLIASTRESLAQLRQQSSVPDNASQVDL